MPSSRPTLSGKTCSGMMQGLIAESVVLGGPGLVHLLCWTRLEGHHTHLCFTAHMTILVKENMKCLSLARELPILW